MPSAVRRRGLLPSTRPVGRAERAQRPGQTQRHWFRVRVPRCPEYQPRREYHEEPQTLVAVDEATAEPCLDEGKAARASRPST